MKMALWQRLAVLTLLGWGMSSFSHPVRAAQFEQQEIEQDNFIVLAAPGGDIGYKLLILEQLNNSRPCWSETGSSPSNVEPLLLSFNFTGVCNRLVDSNGFSVRTAGQDQGLLYSLRIVRKGEELVLVAASNSERDAQVEIGRTYGLPTGFSRIVLDPGWRLTRRAFNGRAVGHIYLTYDQPMDVLVASSRRNSTFASRSPSLPAPTTSYPSSPTTDADPIPVPSLPPAEVSPAEPPPLPSRLPPIAARPSPLPAPTPTPAPRSGTAPSLSSILPPPPPISTPTPAPDLETPDPSNASSEPDATSTTEDESSAETPNPTSNSTNNSTGGTRPTPTSVRPATGVPRVSNSGGAPIRPRSLRREEPTTANSTTSNSTTNSQSSTLSQRSPTSTSPTPDQRQAATSEQQSEQQGSEVAVAQAETYQVVVVADSAEVQDKVRALAPNAFLTTINGQVVMQVGLFRERSEADRLQQKLSLEGLPTAVIPVR